MSWLLHRVDDRLIHGQVVVAWGQHHHPRRIWVVDDACAKNDWERDLLASAAPGIEVRVVGVEEMAQRYAEEQAAPGGAFMLVRDLATALRVVEEGAVVGAFNLGGLHYAPGKTKLNEYIYVDDADRSTARALLERGVDLMVQDMPAARPLPLTDLDSSLSTL